MANLITQTMSEVDFLGLQGTVRFDDEGGVNPNIAIEQQRGKSLYTLCCHERSVK